MSVTSARLATSKHPIDGKRPVGAMSARVRGGRSGNGHLRHVRPELAQVAEGALLGECLQDFDDRRAGV